MSVEHIETLKAFAQGWSDRAGGRELRDLTAEIERETDELQSFAERVERAAKAREELDVFGVAYMPLPLDADGVPIRIGDEVSCDRGDGPVTFEVCGIRNDRYGNWFVRDRCSGENFAACVRHVSKDPLFDILAQLEDGEVSIDEAEQRIRELMEVDR